MSREHLIVLKFGGSVLRNERTLRVAVHEVQRWRRDGFRVAAVVSAFSGVTDELLDRCHKVNTRASGHAVAALAAVGEQQSAALLGLLLDRAGLPARVLSSVAIGLEARGSALEATPCDLDLAPVQQALDADEVVVIPEPGGLKKVGSRAKLVAMSTAPPVDARSLEAEVSEVRPCGDDGIVLRIRPEREIDRLRAARFFMLRRLDHLSPDIPRPFSVYRQYDSGEIEFLIKVMGAGTAALAATRPGERLLTVGPLGNGWPRIDPGPWVFVAGGIGSAPFFMAIEQALDGSFGPGPKPEDMTLIYGAQRRGLLYDLDAFRDLGVRVLPATDDGSEGFAGNVVQLLEQERRAGRIHEQAKVLTCGPDRMMEAVVASARSSGAACWVSLETMMGCGVGICNGCAVRRVPADATDSGTAPDGVWPIAKCCVDGPVFPADAIEL